MNHNLNLTRRKQQKGQTKMWGLWSKHIKIKRQNGNTPQFTLQHRNSGWPATTGELPGKNRPKPENACGLPSSSLTPLVEEVQRPPAGEWCPRIPKKTCSRNIFWPQNTNFLASRIVFYFFENGQKPNYMLQILGKNTEDKFFCRKRPRS